MKITLLIIAVLVIGLLLLSRYRFEVRADILIDAPPRMVWEVLTNMKDYPNWNDQLEFLGGQPSKGERVRLRLSVEGADPYQFTAVINHWEPAKTFGWIARTGMPGIFDGEHLFELQDKNGKTQLVNREIYQGILAPIIQRQPMMKNAPAGFEKMNQQLKEHTETLHQ